MPLQTPMGARGVVALRPARRRTLMIPEQRRLLETLAALIAIAIERVHYVEVAQGAVLKIESERLRNSILSALSHDLRTPIAALVGLTESLAMSRHDDPAHDESLIAAMQEEAARMGTLVENLLDMARIESGDVQIQRGWNAIEETIGSALAGLRRALGARQVRTVVPTGLPLVEFDAALIERVVHNLIENAIKYAPPDATIVVEAWTTTDALHFAVEDDGPGLPPDYDTRERQQSVFDKFARGVKESHASGVGLGLAICRAIVEAHGGTIAIDATRQLASRGTRGFRVVVRLPRTAPPAVDDAELDPLLAHTA
jgi:two-component system sensor histidine kinase KdpD